jgi:D-beta-D-heptose 7-phosphate kinase/D-beta-D-heptose 1-phosphate adenosyltransferase
LVSEPALAVVGDALLDLDIEGRAERLCPDAPAPVVEEERCLSRPGGAGLAAALAAADGCRVTLITALSGDVAARELAALLDEAGVEVVDLGLSGATPEKVRVRAQGRTLLRLDRGGGGVPGGISDPARAALRSADAVLVADYGRGVAADASVRAALTEAASRIPLVWDPHPRGPEPVRGLALGTPNESEAARLVPEVGEENGVEARARALAGRWGCAVAVTLGAGGALLVAGDEEALTVPVPATSGGDTCGAGDRFAARAATLLAGGAALREAVAGAVAAASRFVAAGGAGSATFGRNGDALAADEARDVEQVVARVRASGGTVVATGGCFDLLHAGHVSTLEAARALGDCLIVCLNSDESVRRLKGDDRPLVGQEDRVAVLGALGCVDAVVVFDEDTPEAALERIRPDVFAKGADYAAGDLPEADLLSRWGGRVAILPFVAGRSTTRIIEEAASRGAR